MNAHAKIAIATAMLSQLKPGSEYPGGNINARLTYTDDEIEELAASLKGPDGQIRPLLVATHPKKPGVFFVFGGGRRRIAFERLIVRGDLPKDHPIEIIDHGEITPAQALSRSFADNQAVPMHPADQAATFAKLAADRTPEEIARERGMTVRGVKQSIALGTVLAPEVLAAWRAGKLSREEVEVFTIASDFESQAKALADSYSFKNGHGIKANEVRRELTKNKEPEMKRLLGFVGVADYRAQGGEVAEDFFGEGGNVKDMKLLRKLAKAKMEGIAADLESTGWAWVEADLAEARSHHGYGAVHADPDYTVEEKKRIGELTAALEAMANSDEDHDYIGEMRLERERDAIEEIATFRAFTEKQKKKSGVIVSLKSDGTVVCQGGLLRRDEPKAAAKPGTPAARASEPPKIPDINREVEESLNDLQDDVLANLIAAKPKEAFALFLAAIPHCDWRGVIRWADLNDAADDLIPGKDFAASFAALRKLPIDKMAAKLAVMVGKVANVSGYVSGNKDAIAIVDMVGEKNLQTGLAKAFDPKPYVTGASKQHLLGILAETQGDETRKAHESDGEAKLALPVIQAIKATGWLPPALRTRAYAGPSAKTASRPQAKKAAKKKARS
ncbi:ParB N-terminal domain-containing protein [uncultured Devosia sp.]|uniref:ParB/RepB/Spo0J family partition protein n=1 Tax=uncultured Devosia sp. TaxID=211434 RepID=UPI00261E01E0|nr:ParB N-terminal domain-containing protein [uncultured Devosia sp.]